MIPERPRTVLLLAALVFAPRLWLAIHLGVLGDPEIWEYDVTAALIRAGVGHAFEVNGLRSFAYAPPLWSFILAACPRPLIQFVQALSCLCAALCCGAVAESLAGRARAGLVAAILVALQPSLLFYSVVKSDPLPMNAALVSAIALVSLRAVSNLDHRMSGLAGGLIGLATLGRGSPGLLAPVVATALVARSGRRGLKAAACLLGAAGIIVAPWILRNLAVVGAPVLTTTTWENFWRGNNPDATGGAYDAQGRSLSVASGDYSRFPATVQRALRTGTEIERDRAFRAEALAWIRDNPLAWLRLLGRKIALQWWIVDSRESDYWPGAASLYARVAGLELLLGGAGLAVLLCRTPRARTGVALLICIELTLTLVQAAFYVQGRHRFLLEPLTLAFAGVALDAVWSRRPGLGARTADSEAGAIATGTGENPGVGARAS